MLDSESELRQAVPQNLMPHLRLYRRLWLAQVDLEEAKATLDEILRARIPIPRRERVPPLLLSLTVALVVAYSRPWVYSRGQSMAERALPGTILRVLTSRQRGIHNYLVDLRNREIAHSDVDVMDLHLRIYPDGHSALLKSAREPFLRKELRDIRKIIEKLEKEIERRCEDLRQLLPNYVWI